MNKIAFITTSALDPPEGTELWRKVTRPISDTTPLHANDQMTGSIKATVLSSSIVAKLTSNSQLFSRNGRTISRYELDDYFIQLMLSGSRFGEFGNSRLSINVGDIYIEDLSQPYTIETHGSTVLSISAPRQQVEKLLGHKKLHGALLKYGSPIVKLLTDYLLGLYALSPKLEGDEALEARDAVIILLSGALAGMNIAAQQPLAVTQMLLYDRILDYISQNLHISALSPELLMEQFGISRSNLYKIFEADGGIAKIIRDKRLDLARKRLLLPESKTLSIKTLAFECGFTSSEHFIRLFKKHYGITPASFKAEGITLTNSTSLMQYYHDTLLSNTTHERPSWC